MDFLAEALLEIELPGRSDLSGDASKISVAKRDASKDIPGSNASPSVFNFVDKGYGDDDAAMLNTTTGTY